MKIIDEHLLLGLFVGIIAGLHYGMSLVSYMPLFVIGVVFLMYRKLAK